jgi:integrase
MPGKQAKIISDRELRSVLGQLRRGRYPTRDRVTVLLSVKAGLRAGEIAGLTWAMALDARQQVAPILEVRDRIANGKQGRSVPVNSALREALCTLHAEVRPAPEDSIVFSERGGPMSAGSIVNWFAALYLRAGLTGCSSHSGRRTFITKAARLVHRVGGSIRDVQQLAGHASIDMTQRYIEGSTPAKRALVDLL